MGRRISYSARRVQWGALKPASGAPSNKATLSARFDASNDADAAVDAAKKKAIDWCFGRGEPEANGDAHDGVAPRSGGNDSETSEASVNRVVEAVERRDAEQHCASCSHE